MATVAVILSDLHLGSDHSSAGPAAARQLGLEYGVYLKKMLFDPIRAQGDPHVPFLVLNGDTLDFALQDYQQVFTQASQFFCALMKESLFETIVYIAGNHDHNVWQLVQHEVMVMRRVANGLPPKPYPYIQTGILDLGMQTLSLSDVGHPLGNVFLRGLFGPPESAKQAPPIAVVYPNLFLVPQKEAGTQTAPILVTHGHFFCVPWLLMTEVFPKILEVYRSISLQELEQLNAPLTELGWAALGQAGSLTKVAAQIYSEGVDGKTTEADAALDELAGFLDHSMSRYHWYDPREWGTDAAINLCKCLLQKMILHGVNASTAHKGDQTFLDDPGNAARIGRFLGLSRSQFVDASGDKKATLPSALLFGHTHIPIRPEHNGIVDVQRHGSTYHVRAYNTGGWMPDTKGAGACAAFVDAQGGVTFSELWRS